MKLKEIIQLDFQIEVVDGLRIGGSGGELEIGGAVDANLNAIRDPITQDPYIPGSSLKGKLRSLLEKIYKTYDPPQRGGKEQSDSPCGCGKPDCLVCTIFGAHMNTNSLCAPTRITVRDAHLAPESQARGQLFEQKTENIVDRKSGAAEHPRTGERIPPGARFDAHIILRIFDHDLDQKKTDDYIGAIQQALGLLEGADSLGASGTRGYGTIKIQNPCITRKSVSEFKIPFETCPKEP